LYVVSNSFQPSVTSIERWSAATDTVENAVLSTGDLFQFVSATEAELGPLPDPVTTAADCPKPDPNGDGTPSDCAFGL
jgi:hypothetical protein